MSYNSFPVSLTERIQAILQISSPNTPKSDCKIEESTVVDQSLAANKELEKVHSETTQLENLHPQYQLYLVRMVA